MPKTLMNIRKIKQNTSVVNNSSNKKKVFVGLSGGVDSAVSAALLKEQGYEVTGVFIKVWAPDFLPCTWRDERRDAMRVAAHLNIPFLFFDFEKEYKEGVADYMIEEYKKGRTPNPDVMCNREVKFGAFWQKAKELGADYIATGHYAQIESRGKSFVMLEGKDEAKDQSYFLWMLKPSDLEHIMFPVGSLEKSEVRRLAKEFNLPVAEKKDSQGICFIGEVTLEEFLSEFVETKPGNVLNTDNEIIGTHKGAIYYTIGERRGFEITKKKSDDGAFYVISKDMENNTITVSSSKNEILSHSPKTILVKETNWITTEDNKEPVVVRIRYRGKKLAIKVVVNKNGFKVNFSEPVVGLSYGQSIVFYQGHVCLGGGIINEFIQS